MFITKKKLEQMICDKLDGYAKLKNDVSRIERILKYGKRGEITYTSRKEQAYWWGMPVDEGTKIYTLFYKDGVEYRIDDLYLHDNAMCYPTQDGLDVIEVTDEYEDNCDFYVVDLKNKTFIKTNSL